MNTHYCQMINPADSSVKAAFEEALGDQFAQETARRETCVARIARSLSQYKIVNRVGSASLKQVHDRRSGNCMSLTCMLLSLIRRAGIGDNEAFAVIGSPSGGPRTYVHAFVVLVNRTERQLLVIDPDSMTVQSQEVEILLGRYVLFVLFNDIVTVTNNDEIVRALRGAGLD